MHGRSGPLCGLSPNGHVHGRMRGQSDSFCRLSPNGHVHGRMRGQSDSFCRLSPNGRVQIRPPNPAWPVYPSLGSSPARSSLIFAFLMDTYSFLIFAFLMKGRPSLGRAAPVHRRSRVLGPIWRTVSEWPCVWPPRLVPPNPASGRLSLSKKQPHKELPYLCLLNEYI